MVSPVVYLVVAALLVGLILFLTRGRGRAAAAAQEPLHNEEVPAAAGRVARPQPLEPEEQRAAGRPRRRRDLGSRLQAQRRAQRVAWADENEEEAIIQAQEEEDIEKPVETHLSGKIGAKKLRKLEEKQARKAQREAEEAEREERKRLESQREAEWKKEEERLRLEEEQKEEEERKAQEEQAQREHEEYLKLKETFVVEEEGVGETMTEEQSHSFLAEFINYIKQSKVVLLEDLASQVGLRTQVSPVGWPVCGVQPWNVCGCQNGPALKMESLNAPSPLPPTKSEYTVGISRHPRHPAFITSWKAVRKKKKKKV
uniref:DDRGK domain-containing protein 1 n=1 Tax=Bos indicus x Bos taurus TaxID=30522 RepID=A0A4W2G0K2_BOBOX